MNVSFAVVNRYGASKLSPSVTMCGGGMILQVHYGTDRLLLHFTWCLFSPGIVYPSAVQNLNYIIDSDREKSEEFEGDVVKILLSWKPPPGRETHWCTHSPENLFQQFSTLLCHFAACRGRSSNWISNYRHLNKNRLSLPRC